MNNSSMYVNGRSRSLADGAARGYSACMKLVFLDTETTGIEIGTDRICEVCYKSEGDLRSAHFKPGVPMSVKAMSITHVTNKMLADKPAFEGSEIQAELKSLLEDGVLVAHNAAFDGAILEAEGVPSPRRICTFKVAKHLDAESAIPEYNLQYLRYHHELEIDGGAHDAVTDVLVLEAVFEKLLEQMMASHHLERDAAIEKMIEISGQPSLIKRFTFGKYNGVLISDVAARDPGYLDWLYGQKQSSGKNEEDWIFTLDRYRRR